MTRPTPAFRSFDLAAGHFLAYGTDLPDRFLRDALASTWRRLSGDGRWLRCDTGDVLLEAKRLLQAALDAPDVPLAFRAVFAPEADAATLAAVTDWQADRDRRTREAESAARAAHEADEARKARERAAITAALEDGTASPTAWLALSSLDPEPLSPPRVPPLVGRRQRERLLGALSRRVLVEAVKAASDEPVMRYRPEVAPVDVDPRAWLDALPRDAAGAVRTAALFDAYCAALPETARPLDRERFHRLAQSALGTPVKRRGHRVYLGVALPERDAEAPDRPLLRVVGAGGA
jgi:hypothetical protein